MWVRWVMNRFMINDYAGECLALLFLAWFSAEDIRNMRLSLTELSGSLLLGMLYLTLTGGLDDGKLFYRMLPGLFLLLLAYLTSEQVGYGDGLAVLILGCFLGAGTCAAVCGTAFMLSGLFTTGKICLKKEEPVPFLPFLLGALEVVLFVE